MKNFFFYKTCKVYNNILLKNFNYFTYALSSLHVIRAHKSYINISDRKKIKKNIFLNIKRYFLQNLYRPNLKIYEDNYDVVLVSSLTNIDDLKKEDNTFKHLIQYLKKKKLKFLVVKRNFTEEYIYQKKNKLNYFILNESRNIFLDLIFYIFLMINSIYLFFKFHKKKQIENKLFKELFTFKNFSSSLFNLNHVNNIFNIIKYCKPKKVFFTYEGLPWEKLLNYKIKKFDNEIKTYGYFFSVVSEFHNLPFIKLNKNYEPNFILTSGIYGKKKFLQKGYTKQKVINIGLNNSEVKKIKIEIDKNLKKNYLIIPEAFEDEVFNLINFSLGVLKQNKKINFTLRLHPATDKNLYKKIKKFLIGTNIKLSNSTLENDLRKSKIIFYRGSSVVIGAVKKNILPIYVPCKNELSIDPLFEVRKFKPIINSPKDFILLHNELVRKNFKYSKNKMSKIKKFSHEYFSNIQYQNISKIFNN